MTDWTGGTTALLPADTERATLVGRAWDPAAGGPSVIAVRDGLVIDLSGHVATMSELTESTVDVPSLDGPTLGTLAELLANTAADGRDVSAPWLLSPIDLHVV